MSRSDAYRMLIGLAVHPRTAWHVLKDVPFVGTVVITTRRGRRVVVEFDTSRRRYQIYYA